MAKINDSAFPFQTDQTMQGFSGIKAGEMGLSKLEYTAIKIFCHCLSNPNNIFMPENLEKTRRGSIEQAKLLLQECEEKK